MGAHRPLATLRGMPDLAVTIASDIVCPWCLIGTRRFEQAVAQVPEVKVDVEYRPFLLDPSVGSAGDDLRARLRKKFGDPEPMFRRVEAAAKESGIPLDFDRVRRYASTVGAHTLLRHAIAKGTQPALKRALLSAYFLEGQDVGDTSVLARIAQGHGFTDEEARGLVEDEAEALVTREAARQTAQTGVSGVPFFVLGGRYGISGAQPVGTFVEAIRKAAG